MKKLLGLLGAVAITASASTTVIACNTEAKAAQAANAALLSQFSKAVWVSEKGTLDRHISASYIFTDMLGAQDASVLGIETSRKTVKEVIDDNFDAKMITGNVSVKGATYLGGTMSLETPLGDTAQTMLGYVPQILEVIQNPTQLAGLAPVISSFLSEDFIASIAEGMSADNVKILQNAFSNDIYSGMTYNEAINSSIIGLANGINYLTSINPYIYGAGDTAQVKQNFSKATSSIAANIMTLSNGTITLQESTKNLVSGIGEIIRFVRTLLIYLDSFSQTDFTGSALTQVKIQEKRSAKVTTNTFDLKKLINILNYMVKTDTKGIVLKNLLGSLFATTKDEIETSDLVGVSYEGADNEGGYSAILVSLAGNALGGSTMKLTLPGSNTETEITYSYLLRAAINQITIGANSGIIEGMFATLNTMADKFPEFLQEYIEKIGDDWSTFAKDPIAYLWDNDNEDLNLSIKSMLDEPLSDIWGIVRGFMGTTDKYDYRTGATLDFFMSKSLVDIAELLDETITDSTAVIDFDDISDIVNKLTASDVLNEILKNPSKLMEILGLKDGAYASGSVLEALANLVKSMPWIESGVEFINTLLKDYNAVLSKYRTEVNKQLAKLIVTTESTSATSYQYTVTDGMTKRKYTIDISGKVGSEVVSEITFA